MTRTTSTPARQVVALFNASDDTVEMVQRMLDASGFECLVGCHFWDLKKGTVDFARLVARKGGTFFFAPFPRGGGAASGDFRHFPTVQGELGFLQDAARRQGD